MIRNNVKRAIYVIAIVIFAAAVILSVTVSACVACAEGELCSDFDELKNIGYDLNGYEASITYKGYTLNTSGVYYAFEVTLDKCFLLSAGTVENNVYQYPQMFTELEEIFGKMGYAVDADKYNGKLTAELKFDTMTDYYIASGRDGYETYSGSSDKKSGFLYTDYYSSSKTVFDGVETEGTVLNIIYEKCLSLGAKEDKILFTYVYGTPYKTITTDADKVAYDKTTGVYAHVFNMTLDTKGREIHLTNHSPNSWAFYILAVICAVPVVAVPIVVGIIKRKKREDIYG